MTIETVAILSPGEMGGAVGRALGENGFTVITALEGRGQATRERAREAGFRDGGSILDVVGTADIVLSILPPEFATAQAEAVARAMAEAGRTPTYVDCNAIAPATAIGVGETIAATGAAFIDAGIIGSPPGKSDKPPRFYVSGPRAAEMDVFDGQGVAIRQCGPEIGRGSAVKMSYAGITKGTSALHATLLLAAERLGVADEVHAEFQYSQPALYERMERMIPALPAVSQRYIGEMIEIAKTMASCDMPTGFHDGAAELYRLLAQSPFAHESRDTMDKSRTLRQTVEACAGIGCDKEAAE